MKPILTLENLSKYYVSGKNVVTGLNRVNLTLHRGEFVAITGESGSGKSTLAHILGGILPYEDGELLIDGAPTSHYDSTDWECYRRDRVAFISQNYGILPGASVEDNVLSALFLAGLDREEAEQKSEDILKEVELWPLRRRRAAKLSSGQKQRLAIARALAKPCSILIADEPTGNLDPENSEKVIRLLAQAAKERLVVLITHEFSEAEDYVTRHIRIHDSSVVGDVQLRPTAPVSELPAPRKEVNPGRYTALLQVRSRPVWSAMVLLFFTLTAFAVFAFLGSFFVALDDTSTRVYDDQAFLDGSQTRIVAVRKDNAAMTQADYDAITALRYVEHLERYGYIADFCYAYQPDVDHTFHYTVINYGSSVEPRYITYESLEVLPVSQFVRTVPYGLSDFLSAGTLPQTCYEVVAADASLLGETLTVYLKDFRKWSDSAYIQIEATVVGVTNVGEGLYFSDELAAALTLNFLGAEDTLLPWYEDVPSAVDYEDYFSWDAVAQAQLSGRYCPPTFTVVTPAEGSELRPLADDEALIPFGYYKYVLEMLESSYHYDADGNLVQLTVYDWGTRIAGNIYRNAGLNASTLSSLYCVSPSRFAQWAGDTLNSPGNQVSITIEDYAYTQRVIDALESAGYYALSPYVLGSAAVDSELAAQRLQTLGICLAAFAVIVLLQMLLMRALFSMERESYRILSNVGLTWPGVRSSIWIQVIGFTVVGQLIGLAAILASSAAGVSRICDLTRYLYLPYWLLLSAVHLGASCVAAVGILRHLKRSVSPSSARRDDLAPRRKEAVE